MIKRAHHQKTDGSGPRGNNVAYITYKIMYGEPTRLLPVHITMDRHASHVVTSKFRDETGDDYIVYEFNLQDIGAAMMTGDKSYIRFYQYEALRPKIPTVSGASHIEHLRYE